MDYELWLHFGEPGRALAWLVKVPVKLTGGDHWFDPSRTFSTKYIKLNIVHDIHGLNCLSLGYPGCSVILQCNIPRPF